VVTAAYWLTYGNRLYILHISEGTAFINKVPIKIGHFRSVSDRIYLVVSLVGGGTLSSLVFHSHLMQYNAGRYIRCWMSLCLSEGS